MTSDRTMPIIQARKELTRLPEQLGPAAALTVTRRGKPVLAVMSWDLYESILETLEILGDEEMAIALRQGIREVANGEGILWRQVKKELRL